MTTSPLDSATVVRLHEAHDRILDQLSRVIVGQRQVIEELLICLFSRGHCLLEGVPGLAKTLLVSTLSKSLDLSFSRIQFTPDLMPADIVGTDVLEEDRATGGRQFRFLEGPLFANVVLADEINRTPPKTQAALLEAMQERQVSVGRLRHKLVDPFFVLATQNPIEQEGTYPLPEAQQDRFMFKVFVRYPSFDEEFEIARRTTGGPIEEPRAVLAAHDILALQAAVREVPISSSAMPWRWCGRPAAVSGGCRSSCRISWSGAPALVPSSSLSWGRRPARCCRVAVTLPWKISRRWRRRCCGTGSSSALRPRARA
jgi:MoxR-like ATPase